MAEVIRLDEPTIRYSTDATASDRVPVIGKPKIQTSIDDVHVSKRNISTNELYPLSFELKPELATALRLLEEGIQEMNVSVAMLEEGDLLSSDDALQRFQALLPELFCCRDLGDGFGAIINAVFHSLINLQGSPANNEQLRTLLNIMNRISTEPFIEFEEAVAEIMLLEGVGLITEPEHFKFVADFLIE
jgi:hypothetical protein